MKNSNATAAMPTTSEEQQNNNQPETSTQNPTATMKELSFVKLANYWFVHIPETDQFKVSNLQMVAGADTFLEHLNTNKKGYVTLLLSDTEVEDYDFKLTHTLAGTYLYKNKAKDISGLLWLCGVNDWYWGGQRANTIYVKTRKQ